MPKIYFLFFYHLVLAVLFYPHLIDLQSSIQGFNLRIPIKYHKIKDYQCYNLLKIFQILNRLVCFVN